MKVAIIGTGEMGKWLAKFSKRLGEVAVVSRSEAKARRVAAELKVASMPAKDAAAWADIILVAVPISQTPAMLAELAKMTRKGSLLVDVASVKAGAVDAMKRITVDLELVSIHPLFGPGATNLRNKDVIVVPVRPGRRYRELRRALVKSGARITEMDADAHDRAMAIVQCLTHFLLLAYVNSLRSLKGLKGASGLRTPIFSALLDLAKATMTGNPDLYGELQVQNKYAKVVRSSMMESFHSLDAAFSRGNAKAVRAIFKEALAQFDEGEVNKAYKKLYNQFEGGKS